MVAHDPKDCDEADRYLAIGRSSNRNPMFVVFTLRDVNGEKLIRPISARYMHEKEAKRYEEENVEIEK